MSKLISWDPNERALQCLPTLMNNNMTAPCIIHQLEELESNRWFNTVFYPRRKLVPGHISQYPFTKPYGGEGNQDKTSTCTSCCNNRDK